MLQEQGISDASRQHHNLLKVMPNKQYGVIPYTQHSGKIKLILITNRNGYHWIVPKGNRVPDKTKRESALLEAYEEAGLIGQLHNDLSFSFNIASHGEKAMLTLYPMRVEKILTKDWPEKKQRKRIEVSCKQAQSLVIWPELESCLRRLDKVLFNGKCLEK